MEETPRKSESDKSDSELVVATLSGNQNAFKEMLNRYRSRILAICIKMLKDRTDAEEAAQDIFVKIYLHLSEFEHSRSFITWAGTIAANECRDRLRKSTRKKRLFTELEKADIEGDPVIPAFEENQEMNLNRVEKAIEQLPENLKEIIVLKAYGNYSYEQIAEILKVRLGTVMSRLFRARKKLTDLLGGDIR